MVLDNGVIVDGTGRPGFGGGVAVTGGRIVAVGEVDGSARRRVDVGGQVIAPGFIDVHTHYDAQLFWDPAATPSSLHGVTTVIGGNCGFTLAPLDPADADFLRHMMARVEGMPLAALEAGVPFDWRSFGDYLDRLEGRIGVNAGFLVGHSALRRIVMRDEAATRPATEAEVDAMRTLLADGLRAGGLGFSTSQSVAHTDGDGQPVPSRAAGRTELLALAAEAGRHPGTTLEFITSGCMGQFSDDESDLMVELSMVADRPLNWNVLIVDGEDPSQHEHQLAVSTRAAERGGRVAALSMPASGPGRICFADYVALFSVPGWADWFRLSVPEKIAALADPAERRRLDAAAHNPAIGRLSGMANWANYEIGEVFTPANAGLVGRTIGSVAAERRAEPIDVVFDLVVADELRTVFWTSFQPTARFTSAKAAVLRDPRVLVGGSDAGAHLDRMCGARYPTRFLAEFVRATGVMPIEEVVRLMTAVPAAYFGLRGRGSIVAGHHADLVVLDPATVDADRIVTRHDLPGGTARLTSEAIGVDLVVVNGSTLVERGEVLDARAGALLRSGADTATVTARP